MKRPFPRVTYQGRAVARWQPDRGWHLVAATTRWMVRLSKLISQPWDVSEREAVRQAKAAIQASSWNAANLEVIHSEGSQDAPASGEKGEAQSG